MRFYWTEKADRLTDYVFAFACKCAFSFYTAPHDGDVRLRACDASWKLGVFARRGTNCARLPVMYTRCYAGFWATVCQTVRPMLSVRCLSSLSVLSVCLSVTIVHCGQTVGRIKMKLGMQLGIGPGHIVLDEDPAPPSPRGTALPLNFWTISVATKWLHGSRCHLVWRYASAQATVT